MDSFPSVGSISGSLLLTDDNLNVSGAQQTINLSGQATQAAQTITFNNPGPLTFGASPTLTATASSGLMVTLTSATTGVCAITSGGVLTTVGPGTCTIIANQPGNAEYLAAPQVSQGFAVISATLTVSANNATRVYGTANPVFTGGVTGALNGDTFTESFTTTATITSSPGSYTIVPSVTGTHVADYTVTTQNGMLNISQAGSNTALTASSASINPGQSVTLTATVTSASSGTPSGTVSFYDGTTLLGTSPLANGTANLSTTALGVGATNVLTASYSGDVNFTASSTTASTSIVVAALDFTLTVAGPATGTVVPGSAINYQLVVNPLYGVMPARSTLPSAVCPAGATATFNPATIAANGGQQTITVTIQTAATTAAEHAPPLGRRLAPLALALLLLPLFGASRIRREGRHLTRWLCFALLLGGTAATAALMGCASNNGPFAQAQKRYDSPSPRQPAACGTAATRDR